MKVYSGAETPSGTDLVEGYIAVKKQKRLDLEEIARVIGVVLKTSGSVKSEGDPFFSDAKKGEK